MIDRMWYANVDTSVNISMSTGLLGRVVEPRGSQRGEITDCRVQDSPCWARCMRAFLYGVNILRWTGRLGGRGLSSINSKVEVDKEGSRWEEAEKGENRSAPTDI